MKNPLNHFSIRWRKTVLALWGKLFIWHCMLLSICNVGLKPCESSSSASFKVVHIMAYRFKAFILEYQRHYATSVNLFWKSFRNSLFFQLNLQLVYTSTLILDFAERKSLRFSIVQGSISMGFRFDFAFYKFFVAPGFYFVGPTASFEAKPSNSYTFRYSQWTRIAGIYSRNLSIK